MQTTSISYQYNLFPHSFLNCSCSYFDSILFFNSLVFSIVVNHIFLLSLSTCQPPLLTYPPIISSIFPFSFTASLFFQTLHIPPFEVFYTIPPSAFLFSSDASRFLFLTIIFPCFPKFGLLYFAKIITLLRLF